MCAQKFDTAWYGSGLRPSTQGEEDSLTVFENEVLIKISEPKNRKLTGGRGENFIMSFLKYSPHQESKRVIKPRMRRAGLLALTDGENLEDFGGKTEVKGRLAIRRLRQQTNIKMNLEGLEWEGVDRIYLTEKRTSGRIL